MAKKINVIFDRCKGCEICLSVCPKKVLAIQTEKRNSKGFHTAACTDDNACTGCAICATMCPDCAIETV
jgi:2-oxoglutarate ferredoxin oxidoreductase subunit delta